MGLFTQKITVGLSDNKYLVEKIQLPKISKGKVNVTVTPGTIALINGMKLKGRPTPYELESSNFGNVGAILDAILYPDKQFDSISVDFFGGQHEVCLSALNTAKAKFSIVGTANIEIDDYKELARYFEHSITKEDLTNEIVNNYRSHLSNEISNYASKYITSTTTEVELKGALTNIVNDVMSNSRQTSSMLFNMGLIISKRGISLHLNSLDDTDELISKINTTLNNKALDSLDDDIRQREIEEKDKERQFEIDKIIAERTSRTETDDTLTKNVNTTGTAPVNIHEHNDGSKRFCSECGQEIKSSTAKFCPNCGAKIIK